MTGLPPYPADLYAALHTGTPGDLAFYRQRCEGARSVLELGCGDGRVLEILDAPARHGLDLHPELLEAARARLPEAVTLHLADMRTFELNQRFERIVLPFSGVYCLLNHDDLAACLDRVHAHLEPGGLFLLDAYRAEDFHSHAEPDDVGDRDWTELGQVLVGEVPWAVFESSRWNPDEQRIDVTYRHVSPEGRIVNGIIEQRYLLVRQLQAHLREAGFNAIEVWGGFEDQALDEDSEHWVAAARRD